MRRVIFGAVALVAAALAAVGIAGRRRRVRGDEWLPVEPAPPIGATGAGDASSTPAGDAIAGEPTGAREASASAESVELSVEPSAQPSVEADYGPVNVPAGAPSDASATPRTRSRRKTIAVPPEPAEPVPGDTAPAP